MDALENTPHIPIKGRGFIKETKLFTLLLSDRVKVFPITYAQWSKKQAFFILNAVVQSEVSALGSLSLIQVIMSFMTSSRSSLGSFKSL